MEGRTSIIEVGDEIEDSIGQKQPVTSVEQGRYGLLVRSSDDTSWRYYPYELFADVSFHHNGGNKPWLNWKHRGVNMLPTGMMVGFVTMGTGDPQTLEYHDAQWERTLAEWTPEPMGCIPLSELMHETK